MTTEPPLSAPKIARDNPLNPAAPWPPQPWPPWHGTTKEMFLHPKETPPMVRKEQTSNITPRPPACPSPRPSQPLSWKPS